MTIRTESAAYVSHITLLATEAITDILICLLGFLSIAWWIFFLTGGTFADFQSAIPIVACIAVGFVLIMRRSVRQVNNKSQSVAVLNFRQILLITLSIIIAFVSLRLTNNWFFWISITISAALMIALVYRLGEPHSSGHVNFYIETDEGHLLPLIGLAIGAAIIALIAHRPDADDTTYLGLPLIFLHHSTVPLNRIAEIHNANALVAYYAIIAYAKLILGIPLLQIYYLIMPALFSFISLFVFYRLFSTLGSGSPLLFTFFLFIILILWGDTHRSPGNFAYVRIFQGKAIASTLIAPMMLIYIISIFLRKNVYVCFFPIMLACGLAAGIGVTQTVILIGPIFIAMMTPFLFGRTVVGYRDENNLGRRGVIRSLLSRDAARLFPALLVFLLGGLILLYVGQRPQQELLLSQQLQRFGTMLGATSVIRITLSFDIRGFLGFCSLLLFPLLIQPTLRFAAAISVGLIFFIGFCPALAIILNHFNVSAEWRLTWIMPFAASTALVLGNIYRMSRTKNCIANLILGVLIIGLYFSFGKTTLSPNNGTVIAWPKFKLPDQDSIIISIPITRKLPVVGGRICLAESRCY